MDGERDWQGPLESRTFIKHVEISLGCNFPVRTILIFEGHAGLVAMFAEIVNGVGKVTPIPSEFRPRIVLETLCTFLKQHEHATLLTLRGDLIGRYDA